MVKVPPSYHKARAAANALPRKFAEKPAYGLFQAKKS